MREFVPGIARAPSGAEGSEEPEQSEPKYIPREQWVARLAHPSARSMQMHSPQLMVEELGFRWADFLESAHRDTSIVPLIFPHRAHLYGQTVRSYGIFRRAFAGKSEEHISYRSIQQTTGKSLSAIMRFLDENDDILDAFGVTVGRFEAPTPAELAQSAADGPPNFVPVAFEEMRALSRTFDSRSKPGLRFLQMTAEHKRRGIAELLESMHRDPRIADLVRNGPTILRHYRANRARFVAMRGGVLTMREFSIRTGIWVSSLARYLKNVPDLPALFDVRFTTESK